MCGIAGFSGFPVVAAQHQPVLDQMVAELRHRGPDEGGFLLGARAAIGMRRLSIIDVFGGRQPIINEDGTLAIVFNGEIYNHAELRARLVAKGHRFKTQSDTEVILHLYEDEKNRTPEFLNGMFAFAIVDLNHENLFLARDRFGEKPLFYFEGRNGGIVFASEFRALSKHPDCPRELNWESVALYLRHEFVPSPATLVVGIHRLEPGAWLSLEGGRVKKDAYWSIHGGPSEEKGLAAAELDQFVTEAVRSRMVSDVPVGAFLSGGLDSSLVVSRMAQLQQAPIKAFCIGFEDKTFDESSHARLAARTLGVDLETEILSARSVVESLPAVLDAMDMPVADASFIPTYFVSRLAARWGKVVLSGDGGDEVFGGYPTCQAHWWAEKLPPGVLRLCGRAGSMLPVRHTNFSTRFKLERFAAGAGLPWAERHCEWMSSFSRSQVSILLGERLSNKPDPVLKWMRSLPSAEGLNNVLYSDQRFYLGENLLAKVDYASMAHSLEVRAPFLDHRLAERANAAPWNVKFNAFEGKLPLRALARKILPPSLAGRAKKGFGIPLARWLTAEMRPIAEDFFSRKSLCDSGLIEPNLPIRLWQEHLSGKADHRKPLWALLALLAWRRRLSKG